MRVLLWHDFFLIFVLLGFRCCASLGSLPASRWVAKLEAQLATDAAAQAHAAAAHAAYDACRWALLTPAHAAQVHARGWTKALRGVGVAGIRDVSKVGFLGWTRARARLIAPFAKAAARTCDIAKSSARPSLF
jgi:hypothetical protein